MRVAETVSIAFLALALVGCAHAKTIEPAEPEACDLGVVSHGQIPDRVVRGARELWLCLRRRWVFGRPASVDLLLCSANPAGRGIHQMLRDPIRPLRSGDERGYRRARNISSAPGCREAIEE